MREEFRSRRGYDLLPFMPALAGRVVDSRFDSDRFLFDFRQTLGDLYLSFYGRLSERAHENGLKMRAECGYGSYPFPHIDGLAAFGRVDVPLGEFWFRGNCMSQHYGFCDSVRTAASAGHIYGKPVVSAETLTLCNGLFQPPGMWKTDVDTAFCSGLNQAMVHVWSHQYDVEARPGLVTYEALNANLTWWEQSDGFLNYLARCQHLLRQGRFVADACYFVGEGTSKFVPERNAIQPALPYGYNFDGINAEVLGTRLSVRKSRLTLPDGLSYRYLVLPPEPGWRVTPGMLARIAGLIKDGATVVGPKPGRSPSLSTSPGQEQEAARLADELWGQAPAAEGERAYGAGRIIWGRPMDRILAADGITPDFAPVVPSPQLRWIHRQTKDADIYFIANTSGNPVKVDACFRVSGRRPELWDPLTGTRRALPQWKPGGGGTTLPLSFEANGSMFVVFGKKGTVKEGQGTARNFPELKPVLALEGPWDVQFDPKWFYPDDGTSGMVRFEQLTDWTKSPRKAVKYYSGRAVYRKTFDFQRPNPADQALLFLELGKVNDLASVRINGRDLGVVWTAPWRVSIPCEVLKQTGNELEIEVANLWGNRLIGDGKLPPEQRRAKTDQVAWKYKENDDHLSPSGLLGPVRMMGEE